MLESMNQNAAAIQAVASILAVVLTGVLVIVTWQYVRLTARLAHVAHRQLEAQEAVVQARRRELLACLKLFRILLAGLPQTLEKAEQIRMASSWDEGDLDKLQRLSAELDDVSGQHAALAVGSLRWLDERIADVKTTSVLQGVDWSRFPWSQWEEHLQRAKAHIEDIWYVVAARPQSAQAGDSSRHPLDGQCR